MANNFREGLMELGLGNRFFPEAHEGRRVKRIISPFVGTVELWNNQLPRLRAVLTSSRSSGFDKSKAAAVVEELLEEIAATQAQFKVATVDVEQHNRVTDVHGAMTRLIEQLEILRADASGEHENRRIARGAFGRDRLPD